MLFQKKSIHQAENERLVHLIQTIKEDLDKYQHLIDRSVEPSLDIQTELKRKRAKYMFLLKEARHRRVNGYDRV
ncbi:YaaL family protein [Salibacterium aidingense]|uniref:YaaL family protein n=1 Tax=Salibacterium aidingense TaxID=384933 RepID=UPI00042146D3|nr:YaaL family protein [Salibacterium aidingense]